jgi:hypothetical protein
LWFISLTTYFPSICRLQARIDFETFSLAQPFIRDYPMCEMDVFTVNGMSLCGENSGQHSNYSISAVYALVRIAVEIYERFLFFQFMFQFHRTHFSAR